MSSSLIFAPRTPSRSYNVIPQKSSPLAEASSSPGPTSPIAEAQARRRLQYKSHGNPPSYPKSTARRRTSFELPAQLASSETPQTTFLRARFKAKCFERARRARERDIQSRRHTSDASSDGFDVEMDSTSDRTDDEDFEGFDDELFRRIMANERRKREHQYRLSYELDVGSSYDPNMEDVTAWEDQLKEVDEEPPDEVEVDDEEDWAALYEEMLREEDSSLSSTPTIATEPVFSLVRDNSRISDLDNFEMDMT